MGFDADRYCEQCGSRSPRAAVCGECETANKCAVRLEAAEAENTALRAALKEACNGWESANSLNERHRERCEIYGDIAELRKRFGLEGT